MTDLDILQESIDRLNNIKVPVAFLDEIGIPVRVVSKNLEVLRNTIIKKIQDLDSEKEEVKDAGAADDIPEADGGSDPA